ncbi:hypothetical protein C482_01821 [Natrialba chahannaoensis JCM 10990]|uniref:Polyprenyl synthetase n=1 Tax=Natrialba chahannaoensis JCM 10990 TaxID=1227492 RepID=M0B473_9EURY|nr:hypothetical protein [Natrialba chahannaoensis]ELZ05610.1 hypothetical protein C482_01821 [Natrialba chahannaoensis JCM 10990]
MVHKQSDENQPSIVPSITDIDSESDPILDREQDPFPKPVADYIARYDKVIGDRPHSTWRWGYNGTPEVRLSCVDDELENRVRTAKLLATMYITIADDIAERHNDQATLAELIPIPFDNQSTDPEKDSVDSEIIDLSTDIWNQFRERYDASPRAAEFVDLFEFDLRQVLDAVEYSLLTNRSPDLVSEQELWTYDSYNMMVYVYAVIDLANAPEFDRADLSTLRQVTHRTQRMARIGNWLATWQRELAEGDFSSGVVIRAVETDVINREDLHTLRATAEHGQASETVDEIVRSIERSSIEDDFLDRWRVEYAEAARFNDALESVDLEEYLEGFETILDSYVAW